MSSTPKKNISLATHRSIQDLKKLLESFEPFWLEWSVSDYAPLNSKEVGIIESYLENQSHTVFAKNSGLSSRHVASAYHHALRKLRQVNTRQSFQKWLIYRELRRQEISREGYNINSMVEPAARMQLPVSFFIRLFNSAKDGKAVIFEGREMQQLQLVQATKSSELQAMHKAHLCVLLYLMPDKKTP